MNWNEWMHSYNELKWMNAFIGYMEKNECIHIMNWNEWMHSYNELKWMNEYIWMNENSWMYGYIVQVDYISLYIGLGS